MSIEAAKASLALGEQSPEDDGALSKIEDCVCWNIVDALYTILSEYKDAVMMGDREVMALSIRKLSVIYQTWIVLFGTSGIIDDDIN